ncbi:MAG: tRNA-wybutosine modification methyltransferase TYW3 [Candidatus Woesearchaeota archaeon]
MDFDLRKKQILHKDKSVKKSIDIPIRRLCSVLNDSVNYYTTSSCSGRTCLALSSSHKRSDSWIYVSHYSVSFDELRDFVEHTDLFINRQLWFRYESFILHVCCRRIEDVHNLQKTSRKIGCHICHVKTVKEPYIVEIILSQPLHIFLGENGTLLVSQFYIQKICEMAEQKLIWNWNKIEELVEELRKSEYL